MADSLEYCSESRKMSMQQDYKFCKTGKEQLYRTRQKSLKGITKEQAKITACGWLADLEQCVDIFQNCSSDHEIMYVTYIL